AQALGVVHVLISSKAAEHRLPQQTDQRMAAVPAGSRISECLARHLGQAECVVEFAVCQQSRVGRDQGPTKLGHQAAGEIEPNNIGFGLTRRVCHDCPRSDDISRRESCSTQCVIRGMRAQGSLIAQLSRMWRPFLACSASLHSTNYERAPYGHVTASKLKASTAQETSSGSGGLPDVATRHR